MPEPDEFRLPRKTAGDHTHTVIRAALGIVPVVGSAAVELFSSVISPPLEKRRDAWCEELGNKVHALQLANRISIDELAANEAFVTAAMYASQAALKTHEKEKIEALRNAVLNSALPCKIDESVQQMFISFVDEYTVWHLRFLKLFSDPRKWFEANGIQPPTSAIASSLSQVLAAAFPALGSNRSLYELIAASLASRGLFSAGGMQTMMSPDGTFAKRTTELGDKFLQFIEDPQA